MVLCVGKFYTCWTSMRCFDKKLLELINYKMSTRHLRGSRLGKDLNKEEFKYQNLLKNLRKDSSKPVVYDSGNIPVGEVSSSSKKLSDVPEKIEISLENQLKILEEKITPLKDLSYTRQLEKKYNRSLALLRVFGQKLRSLKVPIALGEDTLPCPVDLTMQSPLVESYRNEDEFSIGLGVDGNPKTVGFFTGKNFGNSNGTCISPETLIIIKESHKEFLKDFQNYLKESPLAASVLFNDGGYWRSLRVRSNLSGELMGIITMHPQELTKEELFKEGEKLREYFLAQKPYYLKSLYFQICFQPRCDNSEINLNLLFGDSYIQEKMNNVKIQMSPNSYFPSNSKAMECVYDSLRKLCKVKDSTTILDIFCGTGFFSLMMAPHVERCIGVDNCSSSIKDAKKNTLINNRHNVEFFEGNVDYLINEILDKDYYNDLLVVINAGKVELTRTAVKCLRSCKYLKKIVYISTNPKLSIDNFTRLCKPAGPEKYLGKYFVPILAVPVDLFPQTERFGLMVMFQRL